MSQALQSNASHRMRRVKQRDTDSEWALRRELYRRGLRYRVDATVPGTRSRPDILFTRARVAVFVDGCFWHGCPQHATWPKTNSKWWKEKLEQNVARDRRHDIELQELGWAVLRIWEHEAVEVAATRVERAVKEGVLHDH